MRALLLRSAAALSAAASIAVAGAGAPVALHAGDKTTDREIFAYLCIAPHPGDWVAYRVTFAGNETVVKTIGFGSEAVGGTQTLFIETHVHAFAVTGLATVPTTGIGTDAVLKTYVDADSFGDMAHVYHVLTSAIKVGGLEYEVPPGVGTTYSALAGSAAAPVRPGVVQSVTPIDLRIGGVAVHASRVDATFPAAPLPLGGTAAAYAISVWQTPDVPLGTVAIVSGDQPPVRWRMIAFGRGDFRSAFARSLDQIRAGAAPALP
jgi:hypothetical protein